MRLFATAWFVVIALVATAAQTQPTTVRLFVTVTDPSGAVIPGATVTIAGEGPATPAASPPASKASDKGLAAFEELPIGRYSIQAEFPGFEPGRLTNVLLKVGDNRHVLILKLKNVQESVDVTQDKQVAAANPRTALGSVLTPEEIKGLSDDPAEMAQQLIDMAGGNAVIRVDSFLGGPLPPKALIKSIHVVRDTFAAENHSAEADEIEILTQPGVGPLHGNGRSRLRDGSMSGSNPFSEQKGPEQVQNYDADIGGTVIPQKASFSISGGSHRSYDTPIFTVGLPGGKQSGILPIRRPSDGWTTYDLFDYALTRDQILRMSYDQSNSTRENLGIGGYDLPERAYSTHVRDNEIRIQDSGPLGRRLFGTTRLEVHFLDSASHAVLEAPTIRVTDNFTSGGAQVAGGRHDVDYEFASDLDYVRGMHSVRAGVLLEGGRFKPDDSANYLGTYAFTSQAAFDARQPATFTVRIGNPLIEYWNLDAGVYVQDDIRVRKSLTLSPGLRYEAQTHVQDYGNLGPRFGVTWAPFKSGRTTIRASAGVFYNWLNTGVYEQTLRVDGTRQQELIVDNPDFPITGTGGTIPPINRYLLSPDLQMPRNFRISAGFDQTLTPKLRLTVTYSRLRFSEVLRGQNLNAPVGGTRPDPTYANVIQVTSDGRTHSQQIQTVLTANLTPKGRAADGLVNWRRATMRFQYTLSKAENNSDGAFAVPPSGTLDTEWGPALNDRPHRAGLSINSQALRNLNTTFRVEGSTGVPYNITTGLDNNGDLVFNDRPLGVSRNSVRAAAQITASLNVAYGINLGPSQSGGDEGRYRLLLTVQVANLTNRANFGGYSGVMTSAYFLQPTLVQNPRKVDIGVSFSF